MIFEVETILIGPDLERGEHAPYQWYQWWRCRLHTTAIPWWFRFWGGICLWKIINIYIHSWICILHMSAVRLYALSEVIKGDNEFKIFMRNLDLLYLPWDVRFSQEKQAEFERKKKAQEAERKCQAEERRPWGQFPVGGWCNSQPDVAWRLADFLRFPDVCLQ